MNILNDSAEGIITFNTNKTTICGGNISAPNISILETKVGDISGYSNETWFTGLLKIQKAVSGGLGPQLKLVNNVNNVAAGHSSEIMLCASSADSDTRYI